uniref:Aminotransferase-like protein n=2 Tax=Oryza sativa subsp. japonica TaxID=39947 RepID=Q6ZHY2_ORYSJ|nr:aminotransferase-like protein [Oryza sativa Japonica Group]BAC92554.1 aminotransferase-like protein [Oryza sativa Japonica Group]
MAGRYPWDHNGWWTEPSLFNVNTGLVPQSTACGMLIGPLYYFVFRCCSLIVVGLPGPNGLVRINTEDFRFPKSGVYTQLEECNAELDLEKQKLADLPNAIEEQKSRLRSAIKNVADMTKSLKIIPGTDAQDIQAIEEVDQIRQRALSAIQRYLSQ